MGDGDLQIAVVFSDRAADDLLRTVSFAENFRVAGRLSADLVEEDARSFSGITRQVDAALVIQDGEAGVTRLGKDVRQFLARVHVKQVRDHLIRAALADKIGQQLAIFSNRYEPNRHGVVRAQGERINQQLVFAVQALAHK